MSADIKTWQERNGDSPYARPLGGVETSMVAEIAELRAALAAATAPQPVAGDDPTNAEIGEMWLAACKSEITYANASLVFARRLLALGKAACAERVA